LLAHGRLFSPDTPASSTTKTGRHNTAEILLRVALSENKKTTVFYVYHFVIFSKFACILSNLTSALTPT
jgi:hypothetical protein